MTNKTDAEILADAPEGATHVDSDGDYCKMNGERWDCYSCDSKTWFYYEEAISLRSLADIEELVRLRKENAELERDLVTAERVLLSCDVSRKEGAIRDLDQQIKGAELLKREILSSTKGILHPHIEGVYGATKSRLKRQLNKLKERTK